METKKGIQLSQGFTAILAVVLLAVLVIIAIFLFQTLGDSFSQDTASTSEKVLAQSEQILNQTPTSFTSATALNQTWLEFDGFDTNQDSINLTNFENHFPLNYTNITISIWAKENISGVSTVLFDTSNNRGDGKDGFVLFTFNSDNLFIGYGNVTDWTETDTQIDLTTDWRLYTFMINSTHGWKSFEGVSEVGSGQLKNKPYISVDSNDAWVGKSGDNWRVWNGSIDSVRIYNQTLTNNQVFEINERDLLDNNLGFVIPQIFYHKLNDSNDAKTVMTNNVKVIILTVAVESQPLRQKFLKAHLIIRLKPINIIFKLYNDPFLHHGLIDHDQD